MDVGDHVDHNLLQQFYVRSLRQVKLFLPRIQDVSCLVGVGNVVNAGTNILHICIVSNQFCFSCQLEATIRLDIYHVDTCTRGRDNCLFSTKYASIRLMVKVPFRQADCPTDSPHGPSWVQTGGLYDCLFRNSTIILVHICLFIIGLLTTIHIIL